MRSIIEGFNQRDIAVRVTGTVVSGVAGMAFIAGGSGGCVAVSMIG